MLIQKDGYDSGDVIAIKLVNGDECVARFIEQSGDDFVITKPCTVLPNPKGIGLVQSLFTADLDKNIRIRAEHVIMHAPVVKQIRDYYIETTTGIKTSTVGLI